MASSSSRVRSLPAVPTTPPTTTSATRVSSRSRSGKKEQPAADNSPLAANSASDPANARRTLLDKQGDATMENVAPAQTAAGRPPLNLVLPVPGGTSVALHPDGRGGEIPAAVVQQTSVTHPNDDNLPVYDARGMAYNAMFEELDDLKNKLVATYNERVGSVNLHERNLNQHFKQ